MPADAQGLVQANPRPTQNGRVENGRVENGRVENGRVENGRVENERVGANCIRPDTVRQNNDGEGIDVGSSNKFDGTNSVFKLSINPNPADDVAVINYTFPEPTDITIEIRNATGAIVYTQTLKNTQQGTQTINTDKLASGTYSVETLHCNVSDKVAKQSRQKLVVVH
jgi:Secretion system C-terminal sorting domain